MKKMFAGISIILFVSSASAMDYERWTYHQDFETHELMAWSSYPPIQDTAYEVPYIYREKLFPGKKEQSSVKFCILNMMHSN
ncbi:MAG: hypothetical protein HOC71_03355 [Candidatus Latescibacteria bacterium]|nr:hypothetical protein [Candidatus Latescibacterota bacterium]